MTEISQIVQRARGIIICPAERSIRGILLQPRCGKEKSVICKNWDIPYGHEGTLAGWNMTLDYTHSFVIPAYKESPYIEECILSLQKQTVKSHILITTSTPSVFLYTIAEKYTIPLKVHSGQQGIAADWTFAYKSSPTEYLTLAHQDDVYMPEYTEQCLASAKGRNCLILFTDYLSLRHRKPQKFTATQFIKKGIIECFFRGNSIGGSRKKDYSFVGEILFAVRV